MRILITGAAGMLGTDARRILAAQGHEVIPTDVGPGATGPCPADGGEAPRQPPHAAARHRPPAGVISVNYADFLEYLVAFEQYQGVK